MSYSEELAARIRQEVDVAGMPLDRFRVRAARDAAELVEAFCMLHEAYVTKGLQRPDGKLMRITAQHVLRESIVFVAWDGGRAVGTVSITGDSPAGLPLDKDYQAELTSLRRRGARPVEIGSLAVRQPWRGSGVNLLLSFVSLWAARRILGASHTVVGVNPNHAGFYRAVHNLQPLGPAKPHAELDAPVTGLTCVLATYPDFVRQHHGARLLNGRAAVDEFCGPLPPSCVEVQGALLQRQPELWQIPRRSFQEVFMRRSNHLYTLDPATRRYLESQRSDTTLAHATLDA